MTQPQYPIPGQPSPWEATQKPKRRRGRSCLTILGVFVALIVIFSLAMKGCAGSNTASPASSTTTTTSKAATSAANKATNATQASETKTESASALTPQQELAAQSARSYLDLQGFSRAGLIRQLSSTAGDGYSVKDATVAVDSLHVDWNAQAVKAAEGYLQMQAFSCNGLIQQLSSSAGDGFTAAQASYGAHHTKACA